MVEWGSTRQEWKVLKHSDGFNISFRKFVYLGHIQEASECALKLKEGSIDKY